MSGEKIREEFEAWHKQQKNMLIRAGEPIAARSCESLKEIYFSAWQASRAAIEIVPMSDTCIRLHDYTPYEVKDLLVGHIESLGLTVKP